MPAPRRPTISEIAARAGVSKGAVSFALNDRPGVSDQTRARIRALADELGWRPNAAARSLSAGRANAVGLVLAPDPQALGVDTFHLRLLAGLEAALSPTGATLAMHVVPDSESEQALYRSLAGESRVDAVLLTDLVHDDPRVGLLRELGVPAVVLDADAPGLPVLRSDDELSMRLLLEHLYSLGHRRLARISGPDELQHTRRRTLAFLSGTRGLGMAGAVVVGGYPEATSAAVLQLLTRPSRPTALVFDGDLQALAGIQAARRAGLSVPEDVSVVAWDGSALSLYAEPVVTAVERNVVALGRAAGEALLRAASGQSTPGFVGGGRDFSAPRLRVGGSTGSVGPL